MFKKLLSTLLVLFTFSNALVFTVPANAYFYRGHFLNLERCVALADGFHGIYSDSDGDYYEIVFSGYCPN